MRQTTTVTAMEAGPRDGGRDQATHGQPTGRPGVLRSLTALVMVAGATCCLVALLTTGTLSPTTIDRMVALAAVGMGAVAGGVLSVGCALLTTTAALRAAGAASAGLERWATRLTPLVLRRAVSIGVTAGLGLAISGGPALAAEDFGWTITSSSGTSTAQGAAGAVAQDGPDVTSEGAVGTPGPPGAAAPDPQTSDVPVGAGGSVGATPGPGTTLRPTPAAVPPAAASAAVPSVAVPSPAVPSFPEPSGQAPLTVPTTTAPTAAPRLPEPAPPLQPARGATTVPALRTVEVHAGDTLWSVAQEHLGTGAGVADTAAAWPAWYDANRAVIGDDPDLIHPGQVLVVPASHTAGGQP